MHFGSPCHIFVFHLYCYNTTVNFMTSEMAALPWNCNWLYSLCKLNSLTFVDSSSWRPNLPATQCMNEVQHANRLLYLRSVQGLQVKACCVSKRGTMQSWSIDWLNCCNRHAIQAFMKSHHCSCLQVNQAKFWPLKLGSDILFATLYCSKICMESDVSDIAVYTCDNDNTTPHFHFTYNEVLMFGISCHTMQPPCRRWLSDDMNMTITEVGKRAYCWGQRIRPQAWQVRVWSIWILQRRKGRNACKEVLIVPSDSEVHLHQKVT